MSKNIQAIYAFSCITLALCYTISTNASATGSNSSGGGSELIAPFVSYGSLLLNSQHLASSPDRALLLRTLKSAKLESVKTLIDPDTDQPVENQETLVAWSSPGKIQLKQKAKASDEKSWERLFEEKKPIAHYIVHELYRASGLLGSDGKSVDENFQISITQFHLDQVAFSLSEIGKIQLTADALILTGYYPSKNFRDSFSKTMLGAVTGDCQSAHGRFDLGFTCIGKDALIRGQVFFEHTGQGEGIYSGVFDLQFFEGPDRWANIEYKCSKLNLEALVCERTGSQGNRPPAYAHQFSFAITEIEGLGFELRGASREPIPCTVNTVSNPAESLTDIVHLKCWSFEGVFVGKTSFGARNQWQVEGELSMFSFGGGNYIKMLSRCSASDLEEEIDGTAAILKTKAACPRPDFKK